ncbi:MAG: FHA domain-containing protein [Polyangiaceae bacterium]|nr:FHA domain-containing protein [Polyangiaceae bacterium]NUQ78178.1 FHA domain-containing protein [Polyangiaceae bacterium]
MRRLTEYNADRLRLTKEAFLTKHSAPVLLHRWEAPDDDTEYASTTAHISMIDLPARPDVARPTEPLAALGITTKITNANDVVIFPIVKRQSGGVLQDRISVGRNRNADIHLPFRRISKFHAFFTSMQNGAKYFITDAGSTNGTFLNGRRLPAGRSVEVNDRALIHFSQFMFVFFMPNAFYSLLIGE